MGLRAARQLLALSLLIWCPTSARDLCPLTVPQPGTVTSQVGGRVDLSCGPGDQAETEWRFGNRSLRPSHRRTLNGSRLILEQVEEKNTGNYTCFRNGSEVKSVRLVVGEPPKTPRLTCLLKSYMSPIRCEWKSTELKRLTNCNLFYRSSLKMKVISKSCKFYTGRRVCVCIVPHREAEHDYYFISLAVSNRFGCSQSKERMFNLDSLLKSDPPEMVRVRSVRKAVHKLNITWNYPRTWQPGFYTLKFDVRYSVKDGHSGSAIVKGTSFLVTDALPDHNYTVQIRAREEFDHGSWSEWSAKVSGIPWADPRRNMVPQEDTEGYPSTDIDCETCFPEKDSIQVKQSHHPEWKSFPDYMLGLMIVCLLIVSTLCIAILIRYRKKWRAAAKVKGQAEIQPEGPTVRLIKVPQARRDSSRQEATAETPFQEEASTRPSDAENQEDASQFNIMNLGYFYIQP